MLLEGFIVLTQDQINMLALTAEPAPAPWLGAPLVYTGYPILVAPEWPEKLELGSWVAFATDGTLYAFEPEVIKANMERVLMESTWSLFPSIENQLSAGLFQQQQSTKFWGLTS